MTATASASAATSAPRAPRAYWICQLSGWGLYTLVNLAFFVAMTSTSPRLRVGHPHRPSH